MSFETLLKSVDSRIFDRLGTEGIYLIAPDDSETLLQGVFDAERHEYTAELDVIGTSPRLFVDLADLPEGIEETDYRIKIAGELYRVDVALPDGQGNAVLQLVSIS